MLLVHDRIEKPRLNGYRIPGELYLVGKLPNFQCCKLPFELDFNLVPKPGLVPVPESFVGKECSGPIEHCVDQRMGSGNTAGMHWVGENHYKSAAFFFQEARTYPIQIKIKRLHCGIEIGKSWVLLAHRKAIVDYSKGCSGWIGEDGQAETDLQYKPGIFAMFRVDAIEYVVPDLTREHGRTGPNERQVKEWQDMSNAGITLVKVYHSEDMPDGWEVDEEDEITEAYE